MRLILLLTLCVSAETKKWPACEGLTGAKLTNCESIEFSKARLQAGSEEDLYAQKTKQIDPDFYNAPVDEKDGRTGASLVDCGNKQNECLKKCAGDGACTQKCYEQMTGCAGTGPSAGGGVAAPVDGYTIEFDDTNPKAPQ